VISLLTTIVEQMICWIMTGIMAVFNVIIAALGLLVLGALALMPPMPDMPTMPTEFSDVAGMMGWLFCVHNLY